MAAAVGKDEALLEEMETDAVVEEEEKTFPDMELSQKAFLLETPEGQGVKDEVMEGVKADSMAPFYEHLCTKHGWMADEALLASMKEANATELEKLKATLADAEENQGEMEVLDGLFAIAAFHARTGGKADAYEAFDVIIAKEKVSAGKKIDATMQKCRVALFYMDLEAARGLIVDGKKLVDDGGDWDRRNRLKMYEAVVLMLDRDFKAAAALLLETIPTFTCTELCTYERFVQYAIVTNLLFLGRPELKKKLVDGPEVLGVIGGLPPLEVMVNGLYDCDYAAFFKSLLDLEAELLKDRYLARNARFLIREYRILVYTQFLASYKSVILSTMAAAFGVSAEFLDVELSRFIANGRISAKIDKVGGKVETNPPDMKNQQYQAIIKKGDMLLTSIQKLARVIDA